MCRGWPVLLRSPLLLHNDDLPGTNQYADNKTYHAYHNDVDELYHVVLMEVLVLVLLEMQKLMLYKYMKENLTMCSEIIDLLAKSKTITNTILCIPLSLQCITPGIFPITSHQFSMTSSLNNFPLFHEMNAIRRCSRDILMRNKNGCFT